MQKEVLLVFLLLLLVPVSSASINDELQKITNYAEDFEAGNINYAQLVLYSSASKERINEVIKNFLRFVTLDYREHQGWKIHSVHHPDH